MTPNQKKFKKYTRDKKDYANKKIYKWQENIIGDIEGNPVENGNIQIIQDSFYRPQAANTYTPPRQPKPPPMGRGNSPHSPLITDLNLYKMHNTNSPNSYRGPPAYSRP